jgi:GNAT superfamily N-acetyltransferase
MYGDYFRYQQYCNGHKIARIVRVETTPSYVGLGFGSEVLKKALEYLDNWGYNVYLLCSPQHREANDNLRTVKDLKRFYSKFGFKPTLELLPTMIRKASLPTLGV